MKRVLTIFMFAGFLLSCQAQERPTETKEKKAVSMEVKVKKSENEWREELTPEQYYVLRQKGTERPGTGEYDMFFEDGIYKCAACDAPLFKSDSKFDAHCGWPSFYESVDKSKVHEVLDTSHNMVRVEVTCANCGGHLGHVFNDGPKDKTGLRYCINSVSLGFRKKGEIVKK